MTKLVRTYQADLEEFGGVGFEIAPFETAGGTQHYESFVVVVAECGLGLFRADLIRPDSGPIRERNQS